MLIINGKFLSTKGTGVSRVAFELLTQLGKHKEELTRLFGAPPIILAPRGAKGVGRDLPFPLYNRSLLTWQFWEQLELPIRARGGFLLSLCNLSPIIHGRTVTMVHDAQTFSSPQSYDFAFRNFYQLMLPIIGRRSLRILTVSDYSAGQLEHFGIAPRDKIEVIHNGADHSDMAEAAADASARMGLTARRYVLALASPQVHKNIGVLLRAFADPAMRDLRLVLFGHGHAAAFAEQGYPIPDNAMFCGRIDDATLAGLMQQSLCFAMPSRTEGFGLPPLEAMLRGTPAIIAPCGALPEVCADGALRAGVDRPEEWRAAIRRLADNPDEREKWATAGLKQARRMSWNAACDRLMISLRQIAAELATRPASGRMALLPSRSA